MKKLLCVALAVLLLFSCFGCASDQKYSESFFYMDTLITVTLYSSDAQKAEAAFSECRDILAEYDQLWSRTKTDSDVYIWNHAENGATNPDPRTVELISKALEISKETRGAFDITVAPLVDLWASCEALDRLPTDEELLDVLSCVGYENLTVKNQSIEKKLPDVKIDLGGIGKGAAIEAVIDYLESTDLGGGLVSFGSNVAVFGKKNDGSPFRIAIRDPKNTGASVGTLMMSQGEILSVSGDYERYVKIQGERYHHILDTRSGYPAQSGLASVAVVTGDGAIADALSTALFVMGYDAAMRLYHDNVYDFEAIFVTTGGQVLQTDGLANLFIGNE